MSAALRYEVGTQLEWAERALKEARVRLQHVLHVMPPCADRRAAERALEALAGCFPGRPRARLRAVQALGALRRRGNRPPPGGPGAALRWARLEVADLESRLRWVEEISR